MSNPAAYARKYYLKHKGSGRCTHCTNPAETGKVRCEYHNVYAKEYAALRKYKRMQAGLCVVCSEPAAEQYENRILCEKHLIQARDRSKQYREEHKLQQLCINCWLPSDGLYCPKHKARVKIYAKSAMYNYYHAQKAKGKCVRCSRKAVKGITTCKLHRSAA